MGCSRYFKEQNQKVQIVGVQPDGESSIPGIRKWPEAYLPSIYDASRIDRVIEASPQNAEDTMRLAGSKEGLFCGPLSGGALSAALQQIGRGHVWTPVTNAYLVLRLLLDKNNPTSRCIFKLHTVTHHMT